MQHSSWNTLGHKATEFRACSRKKTKKRAKNDWLHYGRSSTDRWSKLSLGEDWKLTLLRNSRHLFIFSVRVLGIFGPKWVVYYISLSGERKTLKSTGKPTSRASVLHRRDSIVSQFEYYHMIPWKGGTWILYSFPEAQRSAIFSLVRFTITAISCWKLQTNLVCFRPCFFTVKKYKGRWLEKCK